MKSIKILDCTLRDGGYINNWDFGREHILRTINKLEESNSDIIEIGFIRDEPENENRTVFRSIESISELILQKKPGIGYTAMAETVRPISFDLITPRSPNSVDAIRVIVWKDKHDGYGNVVDALQEGYDYCKGFVDKGYDLFVQPARVEQYTDDEFESMLRMYSKLSPKAIYIVDSWGTMYNWDVLHYLEIADKVLDNRISIGFHGHNNLMQALSNSISFINADVDRELILDCSVYGIGRGAGNLNSEIIADYLNKNEKKNYDILSFFRIYEDMIKELAGKYTWGYLPFYHLSAYYHVNPQYGAFYYELGDDVDSSCVDWIMNNMSDEDKVLYSPQKAKGYLKKYNNRFN